MFYYSAPLSVLIDPAEQVIDAGQTARFNCTTYGHPISTFAWFKNGRPVVENKRVVIQPDSLLVVNEVGRADQGMYQCFVGNDHDSAQGAGQLSLGGEIFFSYKNNEKKKFFVPISSMMIIIILCHLPWVRLAAVVLKFVLPFVSFAPGQTKFRSIL